VQVTGDAAVAGPVSEALLAHGVAAPAEGDACRSLAAHVDRAEDGVRVEIVDPDGRRIERLVADAPSAATIIESWARPELLEELFVERDAPLPALPALPPAVAVAAVSAVDDLQLRTQSSRRPLGLSVAAEMSFATDGSLWSGAALSGCAWFGPACAGLTIRAATDSGMSGDSAATGSGRVAMDALFSADVPLRHGRLLVSPGGGLGIGWVRSQGREPDLDEVVLDRIDPRLDAHVSATIRLAGSLAFYVSAGLDVGLHPHTGVKIHDGAEIAGEPLGFLHLGAGFSLMEWR
jgi:hypothetical protein